MHSPGVWYSLDNLNKADGDDFPILRSQYEGIDKGEIPEGLPGSTGRGM